MPTSDTRDRKEAEKSNVVQPTNPLFPYDKAIFKMLKNLFSETYFVDTAESAFKINAKAHAGKIVLPMITVYRLGDYNIATEAYNDWSVRSGHIRTVKGKAEFEDLRVAMHTLPVSLTYQIDVYATRRDVVDGITAELLMEFKEHPHFEAKLQDIGLEQQKVEFDFLIDDNVVDNSSITEFEDTGRFYRLTLNGLVPMAAIFRVDIFNRLEKEEITFEELIGTNDAELKIQNKMSHRPPETIIAESPIDEHGNIIQR